MHYFSVTVLDYNYIYFVIKLCNFTCNWLLPNTAHNNTACKFLDDLCTFILVSLLAKLVKFRHIRYWQKI